MKMVCKIKIDFNGRYVNSSALRLAMIQNIKLKVEDEGLGYPILAFNDEYLFFEADDYIMQYYNLNQCVAILNYKNSGNPPIIESIVLKDNAPYEKLKPLEWDTQYSNGEKIKVYCNSNILPSGYYACNEDLEPDRKTLSVYKGPMCSWGFKIDDNIFVSSSVFVHNHKCTITRNGKDFYTFHGTLDYCTGKALSILNRIDEHPAALYEKDYNKKIIGRKIWFKEQPAKIVWCHGAYIGIIADYKDGSLFKIQGPDKYEDYNMNEEEDIKVDIFSESINWFRGRRSRIRKE